MADETQTPHNSIVATVQSPFTPDQRLLTGCAKIWVDVRDPQNGKLLFRYDANRELIEIGRRGECVIVDLRRYNAAGV
jgi:hypothetical protein